MKTIDTEVKTNTSLEKKKENLLLQAIVFVILPFLLLYGYGFYRGVGVNLFESGTTFNASYRVLNGQLPYHDFFYFYGPLTFYIPSFFFLLLGKQSTVAMWFAPNLFYLGNALFAWLLTKRLVKTWWLAAIVPLTMIFYAGAASQRIFPPLLCLLFFSYWLEKRKIFWLILCGISVAAGLLWYQDGGAYILLAIGFCIFADAFYQKHTALKQTLISAVKLNCFVLIGVAIPIVPLIIYYLYNGILGDFLYYTLIYPNTVYTERSQGNTNLFALIQLYIHLPILTQIYKYYYYVLIFILPMLTLAASAFLLARRWWSKAWTIETTAVMAIFLYNVLQFRLVLTMFDDLKLVDTIAPTYILAIYVWKCLYKWIKERIASQNLGIRRAISIAMILVVVSVPFMYAAKTTAKWYHYLPKTSQSSNEALLQLPLTSAGSLSIAQLDQLVAYIQQHSDSNSKILVLPFEPLLYVLTDRSNPTSFDYLDPYYIHTAEEDKMITQLQKNPPQLVVEADAKFAGSGPTGAEIAPELWSYISQNYTTMYTVGDYQILQPKTSNIKGLFEERL